MFYTYYNKNDSNKLCIVAKGKCTDEAFIEIEILDDNKFDDYVSDIGLLSYNEETNKYEVY